jgi:hypothetical protein
MPLVSNVRRPMRAIAAMALMMADLTPSFGSAQRPPLGSPDGLASHGSLVRRRGAPATLIARAYERRFDGESRRV